MSFAIISSSLDARAAIERAVRVVDRAFARLGAIAARGIAREAHARARMFDLSALLEPPELPASGRKPPPNPARRPSQPRR